MDAYTVIITVLVGLMAVAMFNGTGTKSDYGRPERYALNGVLRPMDLPRVPASAAVIGRDRRRERKGMIGSISLTALAIALLVPIGVPTFQTLAFVVFAAAFLGRGIVTAVVAAREALSHPQSGPGVSHVRVRSLSDWLPLWPWAAATVIQVGFLTVYVPMSATLHPAANAWVFGIGIASLAVLAGGWWLASWLAVQPQLAADADELAWSDTYRRRDLCTVLLLGPVLAVGVGVSAFRYDGPEPGAEFIGQLPLLALGYALTAGLFAMLGHARATARSRSNQANVTAVEERTASADR